MSDLRSLIDAARADAPSAAARAKVWSGVSTAVGAAASAGGGAAAGSVGAAKMLLLGGLLGGTLTVGIGAAMLVVGHAPRTGPAMAVAAPAPGEGAELASLSMPVEAMPVAAPARAPLDVDVVHASLVLDPVVLTAPARVGTGRKPLAERSPSEHPAPGNGGGAAGVAASGAGGAAANAPGGDTLAQEASMLAEARRALVRRDALSALQIIRGLSALPERQLVPEELAVEAQALRGLGLDDDANAVETHLRARFPDSVLGR
jgi:hypothetical protein